MRPFFPLVTALALGLLGACAATPPPRGSVVMRIDAAVGHVRMPDYELSVGDRVRVVHSYCAEQSSKGVICREKTSAEGCVVQVLNPHYSVVRFAPGGDFAEGDRVERVMPPCDRSQ